jgi:hypothetical protein
MGFLMVMVGVIVMLGLWLQRADYQRRLDEAEMKSVVQIKKAIQELKAADAKSTMDRAEIKKAVNGIKEEIGVVPVPVLRGAKSLKRAFDKAMEPELKADK